MKKTLKEKFEKWKWIKDDKIFQVFPLLFSPDKKERQQGYSEFIVRNPDNKFMLAHYEKEDGKEKITVYGGEYGSLSQLCEVHGLRTNEFVTLN